ncbi:hypothetical protein PR202_gb02611 [Eleusine coracana subsp. coracana]|uniref:Uncharacterized protein n=1 Tax=Eleusine coracana subsp. coracana TaxID=191504 RepID=A0AAV5DZP7_ELECO|nr:hypothetical protein PR202_gb02611 [Eleusine coracana subsp. coracana]
MSGSTLAEFKVDYKRNKDLPIGEAVCSDPFSGSGLTWRMHFYPRGLKPEHNGEYVSFFLELLSKSSSVKATVEASLEGNGAFRKKTSTHRFCKEEDKTDIVKHLGILLDSTVGADVSFNVNGETFHAHRVILASRSPVFKAELRGSMAEATMSCVTLHDIAPATFRVMLRYMYTDALPRDDELGDSLYENLLAAADRYGLDRLKVMCAQKLWDMDKPCRIMRQEVRDTKLVSTLVEFKLDYEHTKHLPIGKELHSDAFTACGHLWRLNWFPCGDEQLVDWWGEYLSFYLELLSKSSIVEVSFTACLEGNDQLPSSMVKRITGCKYSNHSRSYGWGQFVSRDDVEAKHVKNGCIKFSFTIMVIDDSYVPVPPLDIGEHFGALLDTMEGSDVSFIVDGETFPAHRLVLAVRSPVLKAELLGSMAEASMSTITLQEITPATFKAMRRFIYTDSFPEDDVLDGQSLTEELQRLLAAADRYALNRLKLLCAQKLYENFSVDTVATTLACAEMHSCPELRNKCIDFIAMNENFRKIVLTEGFMQLAQQFPSIVSELRERLETGVHDTCMYCSGV